MRDVRQIAKDIVNTTPQLVTENGASIEVYPIPDVDESGVMDPAELYLRRTMMAFAKKLGNKPFTIEMARSKTLTYCKKLHEGELEESILEIKGNQVNGTLRMLCIDGTRGQKEGEALAFCYFHGGSFFSGSAKGYANPLRYLAEKVGCKVYSVEYSLAPEHPFPQATIEAETALTYLYENADALGIDRDKIVLSGDSAGGNLALSAITRTKGRYPVRALELFYPCVDFAKNEGQYLWSEEAYGIAESQREYILPRLELGRADDRVDFERMRLMYESYMGTNYEDKVKDPLISPVYVEPALFPRTTIYAAEFDGLRMQEEYFAGRLQREGQGCRIVRFKGVSHAFLDTFGVIPQAEAAIMLCAQELSTL